MKMKKYIFLLICMGMILSGPFKSFAAENPDSKLSSTVSLEKIASLRGTIESTQDISDDMKKRALGMLDQAKSFQELAAFCARQAADVEISIKTAPDRIKRINMMLETRVPSVKETLRNAGASGMPLEMVEQELRRAEVNLSDAQANYTSWSSKQSQHELLSKNLRDTQAQASQRLDTISMELAAEPAADNHAVVTEVKRLLLLAEQNKCRAELDLAKQQLVGYDVLGGLYASERDFGARKVAFNQAVLEAWQNLAQTMRENAAVQAREDAVRIMLEKAERLPVLKAEYDLNIELGRQLEAIIKDDAEILLKLQKHQERLSALEDVFNLAREWVEQDILTEAVSLTIYEQYNSLPSMFMFRRRVNERNEMLNRIRDAQLSIEKRKRDLSNLDDAVGAVLGRPGNVPVFEQAVLRQETRTLLRDRREILNKQDEAYRRLLKNINAYAFTDQQLMKTADEFALFLATHLLWVRSAKPIGSRDIVHLNEALAWVFSPANWQGVYDDFSSSVRQTPFRWGFCLIIFGLLLFGKQWARGEVKRTAGLVRNFKTDSFSLTVWVFIATVVLALAWPFLFYTSARILADMPMADAFTRDVCAGIKRVALWLVMYSFLYYVCHRDGLAKVHCRWSEASRAVIKRNLAWFIAFFCPLVFFFITTEVAHNEYYQDSLGRFSFIILMLLMGLFFVRLLDLRKGIAAENLKRSPGSWLSRLRYLWYCAAISLPVVFAVLAASGYYYTALMLLRRLHVSIWAVVFVVLLNDIVLRWLLIARRRLALDRNREKIAKEQEERRIKNKHTDASDPSDEGGVIHIKDTQIDLVQIDEQTRGLLRIIVFFAAVACFWAIWSHIFPALDMLNDISLWSYQETVDGVVQLTPLTLANLVWAIVLVVLAFVAARNLPGVLNITLFSRFNLDEGAQYALVTICRYIVVVAGVLVVVNAIGFRWESLQWLIAALGVGIGFGLQEIIANFICGLIILFERPFRLGDVVTSGDVTGTVTRIQIRATTITDWDRHELIVPNKEFITGRLINWTLSDPIVRVIVPVGVAYGSDTVLVEQLLMKVAQESEVVLAEPEPRALFVSFADSSLNFELRIFISGVNTMTTKHQLHMAIDLAFRKAGVTIAFPQRDVHFDSSGPIDVRVVPEKDPEEESAD